MKKFLSIGIFAISMFLLVSCFGSPETKPSGTDTQNSESTVEPDTSEYKETTHSTENGTASIELTKDEIRVMFEENATFESLKEKYNLRIEDESDYGDFGYLYTICDNPEVRFYFSRDGENPFIISYIGAPAAMLLPEYVNMPIEQIPIVLRIEGFRDDMIFMGDENFSYGVNIDYTKRILEGNNIVSIERRHTIFG